MLIDKGGEGQAKSEIRQQTRSLRLKIEYQKRRKEIDSIDDELLLSVYRGECMQRVVHDTLYQRKEVFSLRGRFDREPTTQ